jgi:DNA-directed RNA polymerase subunit RPC12/RpoP
MTNPKPVTETDKAFSELRRQRISLFSKPEKKERLSLFSALTHRQPNNDGEGTDNGAVSESTFKCTDCGHTWNLQCDTTSGTRCPNCGGNRVVKVTQSDSDTTGEFLSRVAGQTLSLDEATKVFSECGATGTLQDLVDSGYATMTEDSEISFSDTVESEYSLFSGLVISVTKELELPEIPQGQREDLISSLSSLSPKGVLLIKRAHQVVPHPSDTGIVTGLSDKEKASLGQDGNIMTLQEFLDYIRLKYNDAPENLNDILCKNGIVKISDGQIAKTTS